ncbi:MAG: DUF3307 domain-containing protein [Cyclobacteriaceae bacterium]
MIHLLLKLILAHILGDFLLQPEKWVKDKEEKKHRSPYLYIHTLVHGLALCIVLQFDHKYWAGFFTILISHLAIDLIKLNLQNKSNTRRLFFLDQAAHLLIIALVVNSYEPFTLGLDSILSPFILLLTTAILTATVVSSVLMRVIITKWDLEEDRTEDSLENAGKYIGILERLFVFGFIVMNQWQAIGFLLAAKSIFRFGDLSKSKDRKLTEYILIGTLTSFGLAILTGMGYLYMLQLIKN